LAEKEITIEVKKPEIFVLAIFLAVALVLELIVTFQSPIAFGDEGWHTAIAQQIAEKNEYFVWQPFENTKLMQHGYFRPPLWNFVEAGFFFLFGFSEIIVKFLAPFIGTVVIGAATYVLVKKMFNKEVALMAAIIIIAVPSFVTYAVLFTTEMLLVLYMLLFFFVFTLSLETGSKKYLALAGVFGGLALLTKLSAFIVFPAIFLAFAYTAYKDKNYKHVFKQFFIVAIFLALVYGTFFLRNLLLFNITGVQFFDFITKPKTDITFTYTSKTDVAAGAMQSGTGLSVLDYGIRNYIEFSYGNPWFIVLGFIAGFIVLLMKRSKTHVILAVALIAFSPIIYFTAFGGRSEDTSRYALAVLPVISAIIALYFDTVYEFIKHYYSKIALIVFVLVIVLSAQQLNDKLIAMKSVKQFSPLFFEACDFVKKSTTADSLLMTIWDHQAVYNCQRNVVTPDGLPDQGDIMLSNDANLTVSRLKAHGITHVFIQKFSVSQGAEHNRYPITFINMMDGNTKSFKKIFENGASINTCASSDGCGGNIIYQVV